MRKGWFQIGFEKEFKNPINLVNIEDQQMIVVQQDEQLKVFKSFCPHRGANLGLGGKLVQGCEIICPFHGCHVGLDAPSGEGYQLEQYRSLTIGGCVFVNLSDEHDCGFLDYINGIDETHYIVPGFELSVKVQPEMVIENAFDQMHFRTVHSILNEPVFEVDDSDKNSFSINGKFVIPTSKWQQSESGSEVTADYYAKAFSPYLVISSLESSRPYKVITSARQGQGQQAIINLSIAIEAKDGIPKMEDCSYLIEQSKKGLELDKLIWENRDSSINQIRQEEKSVIVFRQFCRKFA